MTTWEFIGLTDAGKPAPGARDETQPGARPLSPEGARSHAARLNKRWKVARVIFGTGAGWERAPWTEAHE